VLSTGPLPKDKIGGKCNRFAALFFAAIQKIKKYPAGRQIVI
jgi:hypothetical protein